MPSSKRHAGVYKKFAYARKNISDHQKLFKLKKKKWKTFQFFARRRLKFFSRFRFRDDCTLRIKKFANRNNSYMRRYKNNSRDIMLFNYFYGGFRKKKLKNHVLKAMKNRGSRHSAERILNYFESRLDAILHRAHFAVNAKSARQLVQHGHVTVNGKVIKSHLHQIQPLDVVGIKKTSNSYNLIRKNIKKSRLWPLTPQYLSVNYYTLEIIPALYCNKEEKLQISTSLLDVNRVANCIKYHR